VAEASREAATFKWVRIVISGFRHAPDTIATSDLHLPIEPRGIAVSGESKATGETGRLVRFFYHPRTSGKRAEFGEIAIRFIELVM
jgi:hypothetical protein